MPANKNALIRYKTIDNCLRNKYRRWTLDDLVEACCDALYDIGRNQKRSLCENRSDGHPDYEVRQIGVLCSH